MEIRQLKYFLKVAETLNFSEASRKLFIGLLADCFLGHADCFLGHADFADDADFFFSFNFYVPQISQIYTDFSTYSVFGITQIYRMKESASSAQSACLKL